uniref:Integral membrane protein n=1 Tax=Rhizobium leguminosarum TaxID=384 RepID=A0A154IDS7_RHILE|nr:hypothetical protein A4A59_26550 [Rhizobium leguminosarum]
MKKLPGEVYFFVVAWLLFAPPLLVYFILNIRYIIANHIDPSTISDFYFFWPVGVIGILTLFLFVELGTYFHLKVGFFSAWFEMLWNSIGR